MLRILAVFFTFTAAVGAQAQAPLDDGENQSAQSDWDAVFGLGAGFRPTYRGSDSFTPALFPSGVRPQGYYGGSTGNSDDDEERLDLFGTAMLPFVSFDYRDIVFFESARREFGLRYFDYDDDRSGRSQGSVVAHYEDPRRSDDDDDLRGLFDISRALFLGGRFTYAIEGFTLKTAIGVDVTGDTEGGVRGDATLSYAWSPVEALTVRPHIGLELGDGSYNDSYFGISPSEAFQSMRRGAGLAAYDAPAGLTATALGLDVDYAFTENLGVTGFVGYQRLMPAAADSPIVKDVGSANQIRAGLIATYTY